MLRAPPHLKHHTVAAGQGEALVLLRRGPAGRGAGLGQQDLPVPEVRVLQGQGQHLGLQVWLLLPQQAEPGAEATVAGAEAKGQAPQVNPQGQGADRRHIRIRV